jgi:hypothetical protein
MAHKKFLKNNPMQGSGALPLSVLWPFGHSLDDFR